MKIEDEQLASRRKLAKPQTFQQIFELIEQLKHVGFIRIDELKELMRRSAIILAQEPTLLKITSPVTAVADIHGQFYDLLGLFEIFGYPPATQYLFLGDYVDRGKFSIEVITLLLKLKVTFPKHIHLLRGNHQGRTMTTLFQFKYECQKKYNTRVYESFLEVFTKLPLCGVIDGKYLALHGGISPKLSTVGQIEKLYRFSEIDQEESFFDLLWADPVDQNTKTWNNNTDRGCSYFFSPVQSQQFLRNNRLELIIRGHEVALNGYKYQYNSQRTPLTLTLFSAPNYCNTYSNKAAVAQISVDGIEIKTFMEKVQPLTLGHYSEVFQLTLPLLCTSVTKVFKYLFKKSYKKELRKRSSTEVKQDAKTLLALQQIQNQFSNHSNSFVDFLDSLSKSSTCATISEINKIKRSSEELLARLVRIKLSDEGQKFPKMIGPINLTFVGFSRLHKRLSQIQDEQHEIMD